MLHGRTDYNEIQDPRENGIPEDEPVMLFRAQDALAPLVLDAYANLVRQRLNDPELVAAVERHAQRMRDWQEANGKQAPDVPPHLYLCDEPEAFAQPEGPVEGVQPPPGNAPDNPAVPVQTDDDPEISEGQPAEQLGIPTTDVPESEVEASGYTDDTPQTGSETVVNEGSDEAPKPTDELDMQTHEAGSEAVCEGESGESETCNEGLDEAPPETPQSEATGPLSEAGAELMGGQPTEHGSDDPPHNLA